MAQALSKRVALALGMMLLAWSVSAQMARAETIILGHSGVGVSGTLRRVIERERLWQKRGLDVKPVYFNSGNTMSQAMIAGDIVISDSDVPRSEERRVGKECRL